MIKTKALNPLGSFDKICIELSIKCINSLIKAGYFLIKSLSTQKDSDTI
jgi:hypothetical protein